MTKIDEKFLSRISDSSGRRAFRGQENADWQLNSSALRRLQNDPEVAMSIATAKFPNMYLNYHRDELIGPARTAGFGVEKGHEISDLQLLAKLQHFGAATGLTDFTWNPLIALWFACKKSKNAMRADGKESDGKVFVVNLNDPQGFRQISPNNKDQSVEVIFPIQPDDRSLYWEPMVRSEAGARIIGQASVFVIGRPFVSGDSVQEVIVSSQDKAIFRKELADIFGVTEESLFRDLYGFSALNGVNASIRLMKKKDPGIHVYRGNELHQLGKYSAAIRSYSRSIALCPDVRELYLLRANARAESGDYSGAVDDYDRAEDCDRLFVEHSDGNSRRERRQMLLLLFNRGNTRTAANDHLGAIADYNNAIEYCPSDFWHARVLFNRGNSQAMIQELQKALDDFEYVIRHGTNEPGVPFDQARFNSGNTFVMLGRLEESIDCYRGVSNVDLCPSALGNAEAADQVLSYITSGQKKRILRIPDESLGLPVRCVEIFCSGIESSFEPVTFIGNAGNIGNTGGSGLRGGSGFGGGPGFSVIVSKEEP